MKEGTIGTGNSGIGEPNRSNGGSTQGMEVPSCEGLDSACFRERPPNFEVEIPSISWGWDTSDLSTIGPAVSHDDLCAINSTVTILVRRQR